MIPDLRASGSRRTVRIISASSGCWTTLSAVQLLLHPLADERSLFDAAGRRNTTKRQAFLSSERHANCVSQLPSEHGLADFVHLVVEVRNAVGVPELSQLLDRIGVRNPHAFFQFAYRSLSLVLISRAVIGCPFHSGNAMTTQNRPTRSAFAEDVVHGILALGLGPEHQ